MKTGCNTVTEQHCYSVLLNRERNQPGDTVGQYIEERTPPADKLCVRCPLVVGKLAYENANNKQKHPG